MNRLAANAILIVGALVAHAGSKPADDILVADFEGDDYGAWKTTGAAFGSGPARGTLPNQMPVTGYLGRGLVNSYHGGDGATGTLTSPPVKIERKFINFLIGGGKHPGKTCMNLLVDGKIVRTATGPNDKPGGSEALDWHSWDVGDLQGKIAVFQIVDEATGGWGHINIDHIVQSDRRRTSEPARREFIIDKRYVHLPVKRGATKRRLRFEVTGETVREFDIELAETAADFWVFADVSPYQGRKLLIETKLPDGSKALEWIKLSDDVPDAANLYREKYRPLFHFTSRRGWLNDPNGLVFAAGEYHLFYQHNPFGWDWGNMHWGHAVSKDLVHWQELPIALYPRRYDDWVFSGSAVVDRDNTSGWRQTKEPLLVCAFTSTGRGECIAYSNDLGRTWQEYDGNPVVKHQGRDPRLLWHEPTKKWVMAVYDERDGKARDIAFYTSADLKKWDFTSRIEGFFECPDLYSLPVEGETGKAKWILSAADGKYLVGDFDGAKFVPESDRRQLWYGNFYAAQTFSDVPDGRRIQIGWGQGIVFPGMPFNQQMTVPVQLTLRPTKEGPRLFAQPVRELESLRGKQRTWRTEEIKPGENLIYRTPMDCFEITAELDAGSAAACGFNVRGLPVLYDVKKQELTCGNHRAPLSPGGGKLQLRILVDRGSVEVFANHGCVAISTGHIPKDENQTLEWVSREGAARIESLTVFEMRSAWLRE